MRFERFEKIFNDSTSKYNKIKKEDYNSSGEFPIIDQGQNFIGGFTDNKSLITNWGQPVIVFGDHTKIFKYVDFPFAIGADGVKVLTLKDPSFNAKYFYLFLRSLKLTDAGYSRHYKFLKESKLPIPLNLSDQLHIANLLSKAENLISQRKQSIVLLDEFLKNTYYELFTKYEGKKIQPLESIASITSGLTKGKKYEGKTTRFLPYMRVANVQDGFLNLQEIKEIEATEDEINRFNLRFGDLLLTEGGDPDKLGRGTTWKNHIQDCIFQNHIFRVRINEFEKMNPIFLSYQTGSIYGKKYFLKSAKQTTGIASINSTQLKKFPVFIPPFELQTQFAQIVEKTESLKTHYQSSLMELENLYSSISQRAFRGELNLNKVEFDNSNQEIIEATPQKIDINRSNENRRHISNMSSREATAQIEKTVKRNFSNKPFTINNLKELFIRKSLNIDDSKIKFFLKDALSKNKIEQIYNKEVDQVMFKLKR